jgi:hypothetical protein
MDYYYKKTVQEDRVETFLKMALAIIFSVVVFVVTVTFYCLLTPTACQKVAVLKTNFSSELITELWHELTNLTSEHFFKNNTALLEYNNNSNKMS